MNQVGELEESLAAAESVVGGFSFPEAVDDFQKIASKIDGGLEKLGRLCGATENRDLVSVAMTDLKQRYKRCQEGLEKLKELHHQSMPQPKPSSDTSCGIFVVIVIILVVIIAIRCC